MIRRLPRTLTVALIIGLGIVNLLWAVTDWSQSDAGAYWQAALRLRDNQPLYPMVADTEASDIFRYAPWFAFAAVPFTFLPISIAGAAWSSILIAASCFAVMPLVRRGAWLQVAFFWPILIGISAIGNAQPLMVAGLVYGLERRSGPLWIGLAASLKIVPLLLIALYLGRGEWWRALLAVVVAGILWSQALLFDLTGYVTSSGNAGLLVSFPLLFVAVVMIGCGVAMRLVRAHPGLARLAASTTVVLATPRFFVYDLTYLLASIPSRTAVGVDPLVDRPAVGDAD